MDIKEKIYGRFLDFIEYIKSKEWLTNAEVESKLHLHFNAVSNFRSKSQVRYVSSETLYWIYKYYKISPLYFLTITDYMYDEICNM